MFNTLFVVIKQNGWAEDGRETILYNSTSVKQLLNEQRKLFNNRNKSKYTIKNLADKIVCYHWNRKDGLTFDREIVV